MKILKVLLIFSLVIIFSPLLINAESISPDLINSLWKYCGEVAVGGIPQGSGIYLGDGKFLTCKHPIIKEDGTLIENLSIMIQGRLYTPEILSSNEDLIIFGLEKIKIPEIPFAEPVLGEEVISIGMPGGVWLRIIVRGIISGREIDGKIYYADFTSAPGMSGAPVFNMKGQLVGVVGGARAIPIRIEDTIVQYVWRLSIVLSVKEILE